MRSTGTTIGRGSSGLEFGLKRWRWPSEVHPPLGLRRRLYHCCHLAELVQHTLPSCTKTCPHTTRNLLQLQCFPLPFHTIPRRGSVRGACSLRGTVWPGEVTPTYLLNCAVLQEVTGAAAFLYSRDMCVSLLAISTHRQQPTGTQDHNCREQQTP